VRFGWTSQRDYLDALGARTELRLDGAGQPYVTDEGHHIIHCRFDAIEDPQGLEHRLRSRAGIVEHGMFLGMASAVYVAASSGVEILRRS
jgi:ribose 5-phosphate isomerase A